MLDRIRGAGVGRLGGAFGGMILTVLISPPSTPARRSTESTGRSSSSPWPAGRSAWSSGRPSSRSNFPVRVARLRVAHSLANEPDDSYAVAYRAGIWVDPEARRRTVGAGPLRAGEAWARAHGLTELGSDCTPDNEEAARSTPRSVSRRGSRWSTSGGIWAGTASPEPDEGGR